ncbi:ABC transporter permease subunit [Klebsiella michiganensis]|nr:ABC transporter permease subunit [Klebsiella michiganensis]
MGITLSPLLAAVIALSLNTAAFQGEILRAGFNMLPKGQLEAARDFGFSAAQTLFYIQMPQVLRTMMPALINETIDIIKNSALVSVVAVHELMRVTQTLASTTYRTAGVLYGMWAPLFPDLMGAEYRWRQVREKPLIFG